MEKPKIAPENKKGEKEIQNKRRETKIKKNNNKIK